MFSIANCRSKITLSDYLLFSLNLIQPHYFVSPSEHVLPHTGRKKKQKACLQSLTNFKRVVEFYLEVGNEELKESSQLLMPLWIDCLT